MKDLRKPATSRHRSHAPSSQRPWPRSLTIASLLAVLAYETLHLTSPPPVHAIGGNPSRTVVISQVYGGAGCGAANCSTFGRDFIELFNRGNVAVSLNGWSVQYSSATGSGWSVTALPNVSLMPGQYFLVGESMGSAGTGQNPLPTPDATGSIVMSATAGKVALVNCTTALSTACPSNVTGACSIIDFIGYGTTANCSETANAPAPSTTTSDRRQGGGNVDTDQNGNDFQVVPPTPRNTSSPFGIPTAAMLTSFKALRVSAGTVLEWQTAYDVENLGFHIHREASGGRTRITPELIAGSALLVGPSIGLSAGRSYRWLDKSSPAKAALGYWLEEVDLNGDSMWYGPIEIETSVVSDPRPASAHSQSVPLGRIGTMGTGERSNGTVEAKASRIVAGPGQSGIPSRLVAQRAVKLSVKREGWYRVTQPELVAAGLDGMVNPRSLQLYADGREQPCLVIGEEDGRFESADGVEFYGIGPDSPFTDAHIYWLVAAQEPGQRIKSLRGLAGAPSSESFPHTVERRDRTAYFSSLRNGETENFFGAVISKTLVDQTLRLRHIDQESAGEAALEVSLQGVTNLPHKVSLALNGAKVGEVTFEDQAQGFTRVQVPQAALKEGSNSVTLVAEGGESDVSLVDYIHIMYWHRYTVDDDALQFTAIGGQTVTLDGFTSPQIRVMDVTDPISVTEVMGTIAPKDSGYAFAFVAPGAGRRRLLALTPRQYERPLVGVYRPSRWGQAAPGCDFVIIAARNLFAAIEPLVSLRESHGLSATAIDVEDIYNEFAFGNKTPHAIKAFLSFTRSHWQKQPRFVLLAGDASFDPKNYLGHGGVDLVPTKLIDTALMETAADDWFIDFDDDELPDMAIGRLPARTLQEATLMISKIVGYEKSTKREGILLIADRSTGINFEASADQLRRIIPADERVEEISLGRMDATTARRDLIAALNRGQRLVNYFGHGSVDLWRANLLNSTDARDLMNGEQLSLFVMMTCLNGYFQDPALDSLAESLMKAPHGGSVAAWASSGMTVPEEQAVLNRRLFQLIFSPDGASMTLGEMTSKAKGAITDGDLRRTWILFGDPTMRLK